MTPEAIVAPKPRRSFAFWGQLGRLRLPPSLPETILEYSGEPPHGDPLYRLVVDRITVGGWKAPLAFFGRDLHLSECSRFLAITSLDKNDANLHVVNLPALGIWSRPGLVQIAGVSPERIEFRAYSAESRGFRSSVTEEQFLERWQPLAPGLELRG